MRQFAILNKIVSSDEAEVQVLRGTSCGDSCGNCQLCKTNKKMSLIVKNEIGAMPGDRVEIESKTSEILGIALFVYITPLIAMLAAFFLASAFTELELIRIAAGFAALFLSGIMIAFYGKLRSKKPVSYKIVSIVETEGGAQ